MAGKEYHITLMTLRAAIVWLEGFLQLGRLTESRDAVSSWSNRATLDWITESENSIWRPFGW
jgi:hypothetical protein